MLPALAVLVPHVDFTICLARSQSTEGPNQLKAMETIPAKLKGLLIPRLQFIGLVPIGSRKSLVRAATQI